jgi:crotonobetainyl-CoA:carnitine CoA-transferase CaiB-like acyl-CoA transferase
MPDAEGEREVAYHAHNRNKKSLVLNLRREEARQVFYRLARKADVLLEGFRPGVVDRLGIGYETIRQINPRLVYCSLSGYGQDGPYRELPGHDINYISFGGALGMIGHQGCPPAIPLNLVADYAGGSFHAVMGILAALLAREKTGRGQYVDVSMTDGVVSMLSRIAYEYFAEGKVVHPGEDLLNGGVPCYNVYQTRDGKYLSIGCLEPHFWENLCRALGREDFIPYQFDRGEKQQEIFAFFRQVFRTRTRDEWFELFKDKNICVGKVYTIEEMLTDPQVVHRQMVLEMDHPVLGKVKQVGIIPKLSDTPGQVRSRAPFLGEHTDAILRDLGYTQEEIEQLRQKGAVV